MVVHWSERFGPTLATKHLASEDVVKVQVETPRRWMLQDGSWSRERKQRKHARRCDRIARFFDNGGRR